MKLPLRRLAPLALLVGAVWAGTAMLESFGGERIGREMAGKAQSGDIVMLSSVTCVYCKEARAYFKAHQVPFGECFIEKDAACEAAYRALQAPGTPVLVVKGERQVGFNAERVMQRLRRG
ncbi:glutaredoxin family protein [Piscinibacter terrae]|uniref:Glutaredoxin family protein n=1 Tax=Piscinibacter terrae TaxID=2496871 RepID=A0A3N7HUM8_9BURK|nr:glutaredoxin family protein [Albitalea terrae]RQP25016.1 glutaredoxin family protein [Albitalea terrae]